MPNRLCVTTVCVTSNSHKVRKNISTILIKNDIGGNTKNPLVPNSQTSNYKKLIKNLGPVLVSAFCVAALMYPLDLIRGLQMANAGAGVKLSTTQLLSNFKKAHGIFGFFTQGLAPELVRSTWMRFIKFSLFPLAHIAITGVSDSQGTSVSRSLAAILSSIPEAISIMPLEIAKIALQLDNQNRFNNDMFKAIRILFAEKGLPVFTVGYVGIQFRQALWSVGYFTTIGLFQKEIEKIAQKIGGPNYKLKEDKLAMTTSLVLAGFLAGVFGGVLNTPFDTVRSSLQKAYLIQATGLNANPETMLNVAKQIVKLRGYRGLYAGFKFKAFHLGGGGALMAFFLPFFKNIFDKIN